MKHRVKGRVNVVIPCHPNRLDSIDGALLTVNEQTYENHTVRVISKGHNAQEARNIGIRESDGEFVALLDDDDKWSFDKLERQVKYMNEHPDVDICVTWVVDLRFGKIHSFKPQSEITLKSLLSGFYLSPTSSFLVRRDSFDKYGLLDESLVDAHEYEFAYRVLKNGGRVHCLQEYLTYMYESSDSSNISLDFKNKIRGQFQMLKIMKNDLRLSNYLFHIGLMSLYSIGLVFPSKVRVIVDTLKDIRENYLMGD